MSVFLRGFGQLFRALILKRPVFSGIVIFTVALGIGANSAIFSVVNAVLLRELPYPEPDRLVHLLERSETRRLSLAYPNFLDLAEQNESFGAMAAYRSVSHVLAGPDRHRLVDTLHTTVGVFQALGVEPRLGRGFTAEEALPGSPAVVVVSHRFGQRYLGGASKALGEVVTLDDEPYQVVGVLPPDFDFPISRPADLWLALGRFEGSWHRDRTNRPGLRGVARLRPEVSLGAARVDLERIYGALEAAHPDTNEGITTDLARLSERRVDGIRPALRILSGAAVLVLLIACVNVANLLLARGAERQRDLAVRTALGASPWAIGRSLVAECLFLALAGALGGVGLAMLGLRALPGFLGAGGLPSVGEVEIDGTVLLFTLSLAVATGLFFGLFPILQVRNLDLVSSLKEGAKSSAGGAGRRMRSALVVGETALSTVLLIGAGLFLGTFYNLVNRPLGFDPSHLMMGRVDLPAARYPGASEKIVFYDQALEGVDAMPEVEAAALAMPLPGSWYSAVSIEGRPSPPPGQNLVGEIQHVTKGYFDTLGIQLARGRIFERRDHLDAPAVAVIDEMFAEKVWPGEDPIGRRFKRGGDPNSSMPWVEVVGVVRHIASRGARREARMQLYLPLRQTPTSSAFIFARVRGKSTSTLAGLEKAVLAVDPAQPVAELGLYENVLRRRVDTERLSAALLALFAGLALLLAAVGLYGVIAYTVTQNRRDFGTRMALGATPAEIVGWVLGRGLRLAGIGIALGLALAFLLSPVVSGELFGVEPREPWILGGAPLVLLLISLVACAVPAFRASRIAPGLALREE